MKRINIGILQTGYVPAELVDNHGEYPGMFENLLGENDFEFHTFRVVENSFPDSIHAMDGWLITGSRHGAYEDHDWIPPLEVFIRKVHASGIPMVGICFGHQIIAQALGGKVKKFGGLWGGGNTVYDHMDGSKLAIMAMHQDQVIEKPQGAEVVLSSDFCKYAGLSYNGRILTFQPHPEFSHEFTRALLESRKGNTIPLDQADPALATLDRPVDSARLGEEIAALFKQAVKSKAA